MFSSLKKIWIQLIYIFGLPIFFLILSIFISSNVQAQTQTTPNIDTGFTNVVRSIGITGTTETDIAKGIYEYINNKVTKFKGISDADGGSTPNIATITNRYQEKLKLNKDGILGVQTGFDLGYNFAKTYFGVKGANSVSTTKGCQDITITYDNKSNENNLIPADEISNSSKKDSNRNVIFNIFKCLGYIANSSTYDDFGGKNSIDIINLLNSTLDEIQSYSYQGGNEIVTLPLMFELGKKFFLAGGKIQYPSQSSDETNEDLLKKESDPCERYRLFESKNNLVPHLNFDGTPFYLVPKAPGTLDWENLTLENFLGGASTDETSLYRDCLTGPGVFMGIIWKVVIFFESLLGIISLAMLIYGGYLYLTSGGEDDMSEKARKSLTWSVIGIIIVITSRLITEILIPRYDDSVFFNEEELLTEKSAQIGITSIIGITNWVLGFVASITVLMLIYGGYLYIISGGDENLEKKGKDILLQAIIGLVIIITAYTVVASLFTATNAI